MVFRQVRNGTSSVPAASNAIYPCIIPLNPIAPMVSRGTPYCAFTSSARLA